MPKFTCEMCICHKKGKFFPIKQPYPDKKICNKCITKNNRDNETMIKMLMKQTKENITNDEKKKIRLSFNTIREMKRTMQEKPKLVSVIKDLAECTNKNIAIEYLSQFGLTESTVQELADHFVTVAAINSRSNDETDTAGNNAE